MPIKFTHKFEELIFKPGRRTEAQSQSLSRIGKGFKRFVKNRQMNNEPSGRFYPSARGAGFSTMHRASAWGEPPAPDTFNLVNALEDRKISRAVHEVYVDDSKAPYGAPLQYSLNRPIITEDVMDEYDDQVEDEMERLWNRLWK